ncbi:hypothetical protein [Erythrobacter sp. EC-HK427]|uniref:hypothetical protein n=1 Tax=Erythrobacter sp. EC-HK427 TaxID=2038396 RepID=UPI001256DA0B|nr:hypothetical protein [Erythrobacter sp. EC-HK427]VVT20164.1 exported hypothetical protein [Erythrobacter sp. EC-HK427]
MTPVIRPALLAAAVLALPAPAMAEEMCTMAISTEIFLEHGDPYERGIDEAERARRMVHYREWLRAYPAQERARWAENAAEWRGYEPFRQAQLLVSSLMPNPAPVSYHVCSYTGPYPLGSDRLYQQLQQHIDNAPPLTPPPVADYSEGVIVVSASPILRDTFAQDYATVAGRCDAETRDFVAAELLRNAGIGAVSEVLGGIVERGYIPHGAFQLSRSSLLLFDASGEYRLALGGSRDPDLIWPPQQHDLLREAQEQLAAEQWRSLEALLQSDGLATSVIAEIENALATRYDAGAPFDGYCPNTAAEMRALVEEALADRRLQSGPWVVELLGG